MPRQLLKTHFKFMTKNKPKSCKQRPKGKKPSKHKRSIPKSKRKAAPTPPTTETPLPLKDFVGDVLHDVTMNFLGRATLPRKVVDRIPIQWSKARNVYRGTIPGVEPPPKRTCRPPSGAVQDLASMLLQYGGERVVIRQEEGAICSVLMSLGRLIVPKHVCMLEGEDRQCHANSMSLWLSSYGQVPMMTGYAFSEEFGTWYSHSWLLGDDGEIIETTIPRAMYFGLDYNCGDLVTCAETILAVNGR